MLLFKHKLSVILYFRKWASTSSGVVEGPTTEVVEVVAGRLILADEGAEDEGDGEEEEGGAGEEAPGVEEDGEDRRRVYRKSYHLLTNGLFC